MEINIATLTPAQLAELKKQFSAQRKVVADGRADRYTIIDRMLADTEQPGVWRHTTSDILVALQTEPKCQVPTVLSAEDRAEWLKKIQTRKQHLEKLTDEAGALVHGKGKFGYKPSAGGFTLTPDRVVDWLMSDENVATLSKADKAAILKAMK